MYATGTLKYVINIVNDRVKCLKFKYIFEGKGFSHLSILKYNDNWIALEKYRFHLNQKENQETQGEIQVNNKGIEYLVFIKIFSYTVKPGCTTFNIEILKL